MKQLLAEGRQACLGLQRQHAQDKTEMAKIQGSLQALLQIQNHLSSENKSVSDMLAGVNEERESYRMESMKLEGQLVNMQRDLEGLTVLLAQFKQKTIIKVSELAETLEPGCGLHTTLVELLSDLQDCEELNSLRLYDEVLESFCKYFSETNTDKDHEQQIMALRESLKKAEHENKCKTGDIVSLKSQMTEVCQQVEILQRELGDHKRVLSVKEEELKNVRGELEELQEEQMNRTNDSCSVEYVKDIDAKYQVSILSYTDMGMYKLHIGLTLNIILF